MIKSDFSGLSYAENSACLVCDSSDQGILGHRGNHEDSGADIEEVLEGEGVAQEWLALWPIGKFPVLRDSTRDMTVAEASIIIEYLATYEPGTFRPIPLNPDAALQVRMMDRLFDNYVMTPMQMESVMMWMTV